MSDTEEGVAKGCKARTRATKKEHAGKLCHIYIPAKPENHEILIFQKNITILGELQEFLRLRKALREFGNNMFS
jgi:hypothetical protein